MYLLLRITNVVIDYNKISRYLSAMTVYLLSWSNTGETYLLSFWVNRSLELIFNRNVRS